jgi:hypothetical protein
MRLMVLAAIAAHGVRMRVPSAPVGAGSATPMWSSSQHQVRDRGRRQRSRRARAYIAPDCECVARTTFYGRLDGDHPGTFASTDRGRPSAAMVECGGCCRRGGRER